MAHLAPMNNGGVRFMCQLKRLTLQYCKNGGSSRGIRYYKEYFSLLTLVLFLLQGIPVEKCG